MNTFKHCAGNCAQGRKPCHSPIACQIGAECEPEPGDGLDIARGIVFAIAMFALAAAAATLLFR